MKFDAEGRDAATRKADLVSELDERIQGLRQAMASSEGPDSIECKVVTAEGHAQLQQERQSILQALEQVRDKVQQAECSHEALDPIEDVLWTVDEKEEALELQYAKLMQGYHGSVDQGRQAVPEADVPGARQERRRDRASPTSERSPAVASAMMSEKTELSPMHSLPTSEGPITTEIAPLTPPAAIDDTLMAKGPSQAEFALQQTLDLLKEALDSSDFEDSVVATKPIAIVAENTEDIHATSCPSAVANMTLASNTIATSHLPAFPTAGQRADNEPIPLPGEPHLFNSTTTNHKPSGPMAPSEGTEQSPTTELSATSCPVQSPGDLESMREEPRQQTTSFSEEGLPSLTRQPDSHSSFHPALISTQQPAQPPHHASNDPSTKPRPLPEQADSLPCQHPLSLQTEEPNPRCLESEEPPHLQSLTTPPSSATEPPCQQYVSTQLQQPRPTSSQHPHPTVHQPIDTVEQVTVSVHQPTVASSQHPVAPVPHQESTLHSPSSCQQIAPATHRSRPTPSGRSDVSTQQASALYTPQKLTTSAPHHGESAIPSQPISSLPLEPQSLSPPDAAPSVPLAVGQLLTEADKPQTPSQPLATETQSIANPQNTIDRQQCYAAPNGSFTMQHQPDNACIPALPSAEPAAIPIPPTIPLLQSMASSTAGSPVVHYYPVIVPWLNSSLGMSMLPPSSLGSSTATLEPTAFPLQMSLQALAAHMTLQQSAAQSGSNLADSGNPQKDSTPEAVMHRTDIVEEKTAAPGKQQPLQQAMQEALQSSPKPLTSPNVSRIHVHQSEPPITVEDLQADVSIDEPQVLSCNVRSIKQLSRSSKAKGTQKNVTSPSPASKAPALQESSTAASFAASWAFELEKEAVERRKKELEEREKALDEREATFDRLLQLWQQSSQGSFLHVLQQLRNKTDPPVEKQPTGEVKGGTEFGRSLQSSGFLRHTKGRKVPSSCPGGSNELQASLLKLSRDALDDELEQYLNSSEQVHPRVQRLPLEPYLTPAPRLTTYHPGPTVGGKSKLIRRRPRPKSSPAVFRSLKELLVSRERERKQQMALRIRNLSPECRAWEMLSSLDASLTLWDDGSGIVHPFKGCELRPVP